MAEDKRTRALSFSSEAIVQRWYGGEKLDHSPGAVRMGFISSGRAPLLRDHDMRKQVGVLDSAKIGNDKIGRASARFGKSSAAEDALLDVDDRILVNTSVGYRIHKMVLESTSDTEGDIYRMTDWEPYEVSLVSVPADPTVGVGRNLEDVGARSAAPIDDPPVKRPPQQAVEQPEARTTRASAHLDPEEIDSTTGHPAQEVRAMSKETKAGDEAASNNGAAAAADVRVTGTPGADAIEMEKNRVRAIENMCRACNMDDGLKSQWITSGASVAVVSEEVMRIQETRSKQNAKNVASNLGLSGQEAQRFSLTRAILACASENWKEAGFEAECSREISKRLNTVPDSKKFYVPYDVQSRAIDPRAINNGQRAMNLSGASPYQQRTMTAGVAGAGGYLVATENLGFIELLRNRTVAYRLGARQLGGLIGNVNIPKQTSAGTAQWLNSETTNTNKSDQGLGQLALSPHTVAAYTEISRQLLLQSSPDVEGIVNADLASIAAIAIDKGALVGAGSNGEPLGITGVSGVGSVSGADVTAIAYSGQLKYQTALATANVMPVSAAYVTTPAIAAFMMAKTRFANTNTPLWDGNLWDANGALGCAGFPGMSSNQIPSQNILFGDWNSLVIAEWGVLEVETNPYAGFQAGLIGVRAMMTVDVALRYPAAFAASSTTTS